MSEKQQFSHKEISRTNFNFELSTNKRYTRKVPTRARVENINYYDNDVLNIGSRREYNKIFSTNNVIEQFKTFHEMDSLSSKSNKISINNQKNISQKSRNCSKGKLIATTGNLRSKSPNLIVPQKISFEPILEKIEEYIPSKFNNPDMKEGNKHGLKFSLNKSSANMVQKKDRNMYKREDNGKSSNVMRKGKNLLIQQTKDAFVQNERDRQIQKNLEKLAIQKQKSLQCLKININSTNQNGSNNSNSYSYLLKEGNNGLNGNVKQKKMMNNNQDENNINGLDEKRNENGMNVKMIKNNLKQQYKQDNNVGGELNMGFKEFEIENVFKEVVNIKSLIDKANENSSKGLEKKKISNQQR